MRIEAAKVDAFTIYDAKALDPIMVITQDFGGGKGRLIVECFGCAWSIYYGAMGNVRIRKFILGCSPDYVAGKLVPQGKRMSKADMSYLNRIVQAVQSALTTLEAADRDSA